jgi:signal transduction histidine kinase
VPGEPVEVAAARGQEIVAAVRACLDNVDRHVGPDARAWVLLEDLGGQVVVTVRDEGAGIEPGRLDEAAGQGRLGVAQSIRGRVADLGGTATLITAPGQGTEWELTVPR